MCLVLSSSPFVLSLVLLSLLTFLFFYEQYLQNDKLVERMTVSLHKQTNIIPNFKWAAKFPSFIMWNSFVFLHFLVTVWWRTCWLWWWSQGWWHHQIYQGQPTSSCYRIQWWGKSYKITWLFSSHWASKEMFLILPKPKGFPENCTGDQTSHGRLRVVRSFTEVF